MDERVVTEVGGAGGMPRKLVAFPAASLAAAQGLADEEHPSGVPGRAGNVSEVIRQALEHYLRHRGRLQ